MSAIPFALAKLEAIDLHIPPEDLFERLFGYGGGRRYVSFYYDSSNLIYNDGQLSGSGSFWPWNAWLKHLKVQSLLFKYNLGYDDMEHYHALLVDRKARKIYVGRWQEVLQVLIQQDLPVTTEFKETSFEEFQTFSQKVEEIYAGMTHAEYLLSTQGEREKTRQMKSWLDEKCQ